MDFTVEEQDNIGEEDIDEDGSSSMVMEGNEEESLEEPSRKRKKGGSTNKQKRWKGAAIYKTKFNPSWQTKWPFLSVVPSDPHSCHCSVCNKRVSCGHQGERDIIRHNESKSHTKNSKGLNNTRPLNFAGNASAENLRRININRINIKNTSLHFCST